MTERTAEEWREVAQKCRENAESDKVPGHRDIWLWAADKAEEEAKEKEAGG